ncbi:5-formyltetrahydrofolate cyclo-ligase [Dehalobacter sp. DCM]|uniref:5-formyltetrahydrofolate cyclo-ligase n=1 Tax=Dehalobacter sp. DCM TaxID=2907827 RepID=UPI0030815143|nr:5-formyltetrahydrofolate cyclo-ligase [Dehalobacter sp. DCM]
MNRTEKNLLRKTILKNRRAINEEERSQKNAAIERNILSLPIYKESGTIMMYLNYWDEVDTGGIAEDTLQAGKRLVIPLCKGEIIIPYEIKRLEEDVQIGMFGIREPRPGNSRVVVPSDIDIVLVPGVAFDGRGNRIGFGKGFYDRFLPQLRDNVTIVGLAYSCQIVDKIDAEAHDFTMSLLVTENGVIYCS